MASAFPSGGAGVSLRSRLGSLGADAAGAARPDGPSPSRAPAARNLPATTDARPRRRRPTAARPAAAHPRGPFPAPAQPGLRGPGRETQGHERGARTGRPARRGARPGGRLGGGKRTARTRERERAPPHRGAGGPAVDRRCRERTPGAGREPLRGPRSWPPPGGEGERGRRGPPGRAGGRPGDPPGAWVPLPPKRGRGESRPARRAGGSRGWSARGARRPGRAACTRTHARPPEAGMGGHGPPPRACRAGTARGDPGNDPSAGSPTETLLRLLLPLDSQVRPSSRRSARAVTDPGGADPRTSLNHPIGSSDGRCVQRAGT